jgi:Flp pilus assembly protein TadG
MIEFALIAPTLLLLCFGTLEFCLLLFGAGAGRYAANEGARAASEAGSNPAADLITVAAVRGTALGSTSIVNVSEVDIYKVNLVNGSLQQDSALVNRYQLNGTPIGTPQWLANQRSTSASRPEYLGITIRYSYVWKEGLLGSFLQPVNLTSTSWVRLEPANF